MHVACCIVNVRRSCAPLLVDKAKPPLVFANLVNRLTANVPIHFQVVASNFSSNTAMNGAGFAIQQVTTMSMNNLSIMVGALCQDRANTDPCILSVSCTWACTWA